MMGSYNHAQPLTIGKNKNIPHNIDKSSTTVSMYLSKFSACKSE